MEERQDKRRTLPGLAAEPPASERITLAMPLQPKGQAAARANASTLVSATPPAPSVRNAEWCVDTGGALVPMSTFELWNAIEQGGVAKDARAWCEGLECWTPIERIASHMATSHTPMSATPTPAATEATTNPTAPAPVALEASVEEDAESAAQPARGRRATAQSLAALRARRPRGVFGVALGSAVAAAAVSAALLLRIEAPTPPEVRVGVTVVPPAAKPAATAETKAEDTREERRRLQSAVELGPRHTEPGQRRKRR